VSRGRPRNTARADARLAGERFYADAVECDFCATNKRYVSNAACVACSIASGNARYAAMSEAQRQAQAVRDRNRYLARKANAAE